MYIFILNFFDIFKLTFTIFLQFCDLLWYTWAILLYEKRREEIYNEIAQAKLHRLINPRKIVY